MELFSCPLSGDGRVPGRSFLAVIEGGEEADGQEGRSGIHEFLGVLSTQNRWLLLTRLTTQAAPVESVLLREALHQDEASRLFDSLTERRVPGAVRDQALDLLAGHPLALTWAANLLAREDEDPARLVVDWKAQDLPKLTDPQRAEHTLEWLMNRSVRGLDLPTRQALTAGALLAHAPFPLDAIDAALRDSRSETHGYTPDVARQALKALVQRSLLRRVTELADHWQFAHVLSYRFARQERGSDTIVRLRLGRWLNGYLKTTLMADSIEGDSVNASYARTSRCVIARGRRSESLGDPGKSSTLRFSRAPE